MQHAIPVEHLGPQGDAMAHAVEKCVHCGFCLAACPTYKVLGEEMDSPRGRIYLMKEALEGHLTVDAMAPYIDRCLGCMACVTACPSGVEYGELLAPFRAFAEPKRSRTGLERLTRLLVKETLPYPGRFRLAASLGHLARPFQRLLPGPFAAMLELLPASLPTAPRLPERYPAVGRRRARVALLAGCVQQVLAPQINWATLRVLARNGVEVVIPRGQGCCGSLSMHIGEAEQARALARRNLAAWPEDVDAVLTNAAGCGSGMREYGLLFKGEPEEEAARRLAEKTQDVSVFLQELGLEPPPPLPEAITAAYHDACHLAHAQRVTAQPRRLLASVPNLSLVEIPEGELCCGSAGTYNLEQPEVAAELGERKARNILATGAQAVITGNIGCMTQIQAHLQALGHDLPVWHTMEVLDRAYRAAQPSRG
ncbi:glycolate oxidase subunit GlcF [Litorilinea aerophila]|uniref:Glycolate oxidase iron-sulfur subunit n=1 Tax=Litorilinea aerophila TaxID=1204385 RepID=A0A540VFW5_9CHLR|nr:glycolate oxidase subunit GlcF [Litorilinea aerophila]MCC9076651.1 glycolate oxidase subunit GlcF [Litorilinea aerophila]GIV77687.1 MAG: glycolate oxidase iron-sulfur subunit [Litorilinea sp.]